MVNRYRPIPTSADQLQKIYKVKSGIYSMTKCRQCGAEISDSMIMDIVMDPFVSVHNGHIQRGVPVP